MAGAIRWFDAKTRDVPREQLLAGAFAAGCISAIIVRRVHVRYLRRLPSSEWVTPDVLKKKRWIKGFVTRFVFQSCVEIVVRTCVVQRW